MADIAGKYIEALPEDRKEPYRQLLNVIRENIPSGFKEVMANSPSYIVPLELFPDGYHCTPNTPLPYLSLASQKNFISLHHFGMYMNQKLTQWFIKSYAEQVESKLDMGKSCVRFKKMDQIPYALVGELIAKMSLEDFVAGYEKAMNRTK
jgi:hypothetical protein